MPSPAFFNILLFVMVLLLGITSLTAMAEVSISIIRDQIQEFLDSGSGVARGILSRSWIIPVFVCVVQLLIGLTFCRRSGNLWIDLVDGAISKFLLTFIGVWEFIAVAWIFGLPQIREVYFKRLGWFPKRYLGFIWSYYGPIVMSVMLVIGFEDYVRNPVTEVAWAAAISWLMVVIPPLVWLVLALRAPDHDGKFITFRSITDWVSDWRRGGGARGEGADGMEMTLNKQVSHAGLLNHASETGA